MGREQQDQVTIPSQEGLPTRDTCEISVGPCWYFFSKGKQTGPVREQALIDRWISGELNDDDLIWRPGLASWVKAANVRGLASVPANELPPELPPMAACVDAIKGEASETAGESARLSTDPPTVAPVLPAPDSPLPQGADPVNGALILTSSAASPTHATDGPTVLSGQAVVTFSAVCVGAYLFPWTEGAYRPSAFTSWILAGISVWVFSITLHKGFRRSSDTCVRGYGKFIFTAVAGVLLLLFFQKLVVAFASGKDPPGIGPKWFLVLRAIGKGYQSALQPTGSFFGTLVATFFSVALCEEFIKALPVLRMVLSKKVNLMSKSEVDLMRADLPFLGAMSGLGFGIAEGMWYASEVYGKGDFPFGIYLVRFFGCAPLHAAWGGLTALWIGRDMPALRSAFRRRSEPAKDGEAGWQHLTLTYFAMQIPAMALHSLYNASMAKGWTTVGILIVALSVLCLWLMSAAYMEDVLKEADGKPAEGTSAGECQSTSSPVSVGQPQVATSDS